MVIWTTLALTALSVAVIERLTPLYTASGQVLVGVEQVTVSKVQDLAAGLDTQTERVATEIGIIRARNMAEQIINQLGLENDPEFNPALREPNEAQAWLDAADDHPAFLADQDRGAAQARRRPGHDRDVEDDR